MVLSTRSTGGGAVGAQQSFVPRTPSYSHTRWAQEGTSWKSSNCGFFIKIKWVSSDSFGPGRLRHAPALLSAHYAHGTLTSCGGVRTPHRCRSHQESALSSAPRMWSAVFKFLFPGKSDVGRSCKAVSAGLGGRPVRGCSRRPPPPPVARPVGFP